MAKRKSENDDDIFGDLQIADTDEATTPANKKSRKISQELEYEDDEYGPPPELTPEMPMFGTQNDNKAKRVRKKSAKVLEMEEAEAFEKKVDKKVFKSPPKVGSAGSVKKIKNKTMVYPKLNHEIANLPLEVKPEIQLDNTVTVAEPEEIPTVVLPPVPVVKSTPKTSAKPTPKTSAKARKVTKSKASKAPNEVVSTNSPPEFPLTCSTTEIGSPNNTETAIKSEHITSPKAKHKSEHSTPPKAKHKKVKSKKSKVDKTELTLELPPEQITSPVSYSSVKQADESGIKLKLCLNSPKEPVNDSMDLKSDDDQPAIWPSLCNDTPEQVVVKLKKKKKSKKHKDIPEPDDNIFVENNQENISFPTETADELDKMLSDKNDIKTKTEIKMDPELDNNHEDCLVIDTENKKTKKKRNKKVKTKKGEIPIPNDLVSEDPELEADPDADPEADPDADPDSGVHPVNLYSNVDAMAMKVKTSSERKAESINPSKIAGKKKKYRRKGPTAYTMFSHVYRAKVLAENPGSDFANCSNRLGEIWQCLPAKEKSFWKRKAKQRCNRLNKLGLSNGSVTHSPDHDMVFTSKVPNVLNRPNKRHMNKHCLLNKKSTPTIEPPKVKVEPMLPPVAPVSNEEDAGSSLLGQLLTSQVSEQPPAKVKSKKLTAAEKAYISPVNVAAHLKLLGDSLHTIGCRLREHRGPIAVQGTLSVLLDSSLCAMGSLMCLTNGVPQVQLPHDVHSQNLDNIAHIMPGIG